MIPTREEILEMAKDAGFSVTDPSVYIDGNCIGPVSHFEGWPQHLERFAKLIYAAGHRDGQEYSLDRVCDKLVEMKRKYDRMEQFAEKDAVALCIVEVEEMEVRELP